MIRDLITLSLFLAVAIAIYRYHRQVADALRRFDARNVQRIKDQEAEKADPLAHYKHTLKTAEEQVEAVSEITTAMATRYVFEGQHFGTRWEAENARAEKIRAIARSYYVELPAALAERRDPSTVASSSPAPKPAAPGNVVPFRRGDETLH